ncbi:MAG: hypothetical protein M1812_005742 [Candelaria pacifica]|nr:MAG: hypothetical protein M1812_005742 [Candelaria pacifica]
MDSQLFVTSAAVMLLVICSVLVIRRQRNFQSLQSAEKSAHSSLTASLLEQDELSKCLASALPNSVTLPHDVAAFKQSMNSYWAQQECEVVPACVVQPRDVQELCTAVNVIRRNYSSQMGQTGLEKAEGIFAVRSGGHSPVAYAASIKGGVVIDLHHFCGVIPSEDGTTVIIGAGAKWMDVSKVLDGKGLAVVGGRNSAVGVGGLTLGGGLSFFSPRFGLVCSNVISYEIVLASGVVTTATASHNADLWRALKGGSNNFGIVTRFTTRSFPSTQIWSGFLYVPNFQAPRVLAAFHEFISRADANNTDVSYDQNAAGPLACFSYLPKLGIQAIAVNLVYTKQPPHDSKKWPTCWRTSSFASLWRFWSTCKVRSLSSATDEMNVLNPPGRRQHFATTTIKNDPATIAAAHSAYNDAIASIRQVSVKGLLWTMVLQPLLPAWARKGDANPLGLDSTNESLVIVSFTVNWDERRDDEFIKSLTRRTIEQIDAFAAANATGHPFRYLNYCAEWQKPFVGYGEENLRFLWGVSRRYDPGGLFQKGCVGGFKLDIED